MIICIVGDSRDLSAVYMRWLAERRGYAVLALDEASLGVTWAYRISHDGDLTISHQGRVYAALEVDGMFVRLNPNPDVPEGLELSEVESGALQVERRGAVEMMLDRFPGSVVNRPSCGRSNGSKPYQMIRLAEQGFAVPDWIVTNLPDRLNDFCGRYANGAIYKACSGLRTHVRRVDDALLDRIATGTTPVVVQQYIPGRDVRVHVVGDRTFGTQITSTAVDYRFETEDCQYQTDSVPEPIAELCRVSVRQEGLALGGLDFRVTQDEHWYCLELNPVPTFLPYEMETGHPIGEAILDVLTSR